MRETRVGHPHRHDVIRWSSSRGKSGFPSHHTTEVPTEKKLSWMEGRFWKIGKNWYNLHCKRKDFLNVWASGWSTCPGRVRDPCPAMGTSDHGNYWERANLFCAAVSSAYMLVGIGGQRGGAWSSWLPWLHVHRFGHHLRESWACGGQKRIHYSDSHFDYA